MPKTQKVKLSEIRIDGGTQARAAFNHNYVTELRELITLGTDLPPVVIFDDGEHKWLADGFHRHRSATDENLEEIEAEVRKGTLRDAVLYAAGANTSHGLRRTAEDKRKAVQLLLADAEWCNRTDRWIAEQCNVSHAFVGNVRMSSGGNESTSNGESNGEGPAKRIGKDGKKHKSGRGRPKGSKNKPQPLFEERVEGGDLDDEQKPIPENGSVIGWSWPEFWKRYKYTAGLHDAIAKEFKGEKKSPWYSNIDGTLSTLTNQLREWEKEIKERLKEEAKAEREAEKAKIRAEREAAKASK